MFVRIRSRRPLRAALLCSVLVAAGASPAFASPFDITSGTNTNPQTLDTGETGTVANGAALGITSKDVAVTINGGNVTLSNAGTISDTKKRAVDTTFGNGNYNLTFNNSGTITSSAADSLRINADTGTGTVQLTNSGTISETGTGGNNGQAIDFNAINGGTGKVTITNLAGGLITAADSDAIRPGTNTTVNNYGTISGHTAGDSGNDGIDFQDTGTGAVNNYLGGIITGARHGITGDLPVTVTNAGTITGEDGSGLNFDTQPGTTMNVTNTGTITGTAVTGDGDGIDIDGLAHIDNYGTIQTAGTVSGEINEGLALGGGTINNYAGGTIESVQRAITIDDSSLGDAFGATTITNHGTIAGGDGEAINITSTFANTLTNYGTITGSTVMGSGNDTINLYTGSKTGSLDGGAGTDAIHLLGTGSGALANVTNVESLEVGGGNWTVSGTQTYSSGITVDAGATATVSGMLGGNVTNNGTVAVEGGSATFTGTFTNNGAFVSDPAVQTFDNFMQSADGYIQAASGDTYLIGGDFESFSTQNTLWNTDGAILDFFGSSGTTHQMLLDGADEGLGSHIHDNFGWDELVIDAGNSITLGDGGGSGDQALYLLALSGAEFTGDLITNITGYAGATIYYDPYLAANSYLKGLDYDLTGGGRLVANVPEPATLAVLIGGLGLFGFARRRRTKPKN